MPRAQVPTFTRADDQDALLTAIHQLLTAARDEGDKALSADICLLLTCVSGSDAATPGHWRALRHLQTRLRRHMDNSEMELPELVALIQDAAKEEGADDEDAFQFCAMVLDRYSLRAIQQSDRRAWYRNWAATRP